MRANDDKQTNQLLSVPINSQQITAMFESQCPANDTACSDEDVDLTGLAPNSAENLNAVDDNMNNTNKIELLFNQQQNHSFNIITNDLVVFSKRP